MEGPLRKITWFLQANIVKEKKGNSKGPKSHRDWFPSSQANLDNWEDYENPGKPSAQHSVKEAPRTGRERKLKEEPGLKRV